jgi:sugar/nucleoside kinase (ribokinase family)
LGGELKLAVRAKSPNIGKSFGRGSTLNSTSMLKEVDTTGCGDAFLAGLVSQILDRDDKPDDSDETTLNNMMRYANAVGALTATGQGAVTALPRVDAVAKMIDV